MIKIKNKRYRKGSLLPLAISYILLAFAIFGFSYDIANILYYKVYLRNLASTLSMSMTNQCYYYGVGYEWVSDGMSGEGYFKMGSYDPTVANVIVMPNPNDVSGYDAVSKGKYVIGKTANGISVTHANIYDVYVTQKDVRNGQIHYADDKYLERLVEKQSFKNDKIAKNSETMNQPAEIQFIRKGNSQINLSDGSIFNTSQKNEDGEYIKSAFVLDLDNSQINRDYKSMDPKEKPSYQYIIAKYHEDSEYFNRYLHGRDQHNGECEVYLVGYVKLLFINTHPFDFSGVSKTRIDTYAISQPRFLQYDTEAITGGQDSSDGESTFIPNN